MTGTTKDSIFNVGGQRSYKCDSSRSYDMNQVPSGALQNLEVKLSNFQAQAFSFKNDDDQFDKSKPIHVCVGVCVCVYIFLCVRNFGCTQFVTISFPHRYHVH